MEAGLGELGFWLMLGMVVAAGIVSSAIKERDKEREKQATLRALLEKDGKTATEVLAYMRDKDAAEAALYREAMGLDFLARISNSLAKISKRLPALAMGVFTIAGGIFAFAALRFDILRSADSALIPLVTMLGIWAVGLIVASRMWRSAKQKDDAHPDA